MKLRLHMIWLIALSWEWVYANMLCLPPLQKKLGSWILQWDDSVSNKHQHSSHWQVCQALKMLIFLNVVKVSSVCLEIMGNLVWVKTVLILVSYEVIQKFLSEMKLACFRNSCERNSFIPSKMTCGCSTEDVGNLPNKTEQNSTGQ